jgi:uncharacterized protein YjiS (DUF1127 family)
VVFAVAVQVMTWETRYRTRKSLRDLDDHVLKDIGLSRAEAQKEAARPFWLR